MSSSVVPWREPSRPQSRWVFGLYPEAGEGGGSFQSVYRRVPAYVSRGFAANPERSAEEAGRRARATLRRYCATNRLNRLGTLTFAGQGCHDPVELRAHLADFFRTLRTLTGGEAFPYVWVPEWHKSGHGLHAHFAVGKFIRRAVIVQAWGHGFVHIKLLGDLPVGSGSLSESRVAARYLSKYVAKTFADPAARALGLHRYDVAQGFKPVPVSLFGPTADDVIGQASTFFDAAPLIRWDSSERPEWQAPPAVWVQWGR